MTEPSSSAARTEPSATPAQSGGGDGAMSANASAVPTPEFPPASTGNKVGWLIGLIIVILGL